MFVEGSSVNIDSDNASMLHPARGVNFDPGVEVIAFNENLPPAKLGLLGRTYERNIDSSVMVPKSWSFASNTSCASNGTDIRAVTSTLLTVIPEDPYLSAASVPTDESRPVPSRLPSSPTFKAQAKDPVMLQAQELVVTEVGTKK
jgi:hypothetical protein